MTAVRYGALPEEWAHFSDTLGLTADLLPVVANPRAEKSEASSLKGLGKTPSIYNRDRKVVGFGQWTQHQATAADVSRWAMERDYGICVQTRTIRAVDIDVDDPARAVALATALVDAAGIAPRFMPVRYRENSGRLLLPFFVPIAGAKAAFKVEGGQVEYLGAGQQFVACGTHSSGARLLWSTLEALLDTRGLA